MAADEPSEGHTAQSHTMDTVPAEHTFTADAREQTVLDDDKTDKASNASPTDEKAVEAPPAGLSVHQEKERSTGKIALIMFSLCVSKQHRVKQLS